MPVTLRATAGPYAGRSFTLENPGTHVVGRHQDAGLSLPDDQALSRRHFLIEAALPACRVVDLGSRHGTLVNGRAVATADLTDGDTLAAGNSAFRVELIDSASADPDETHDQDTPALPAPGLHGLPDVPGYRLERELGRGGMGVVYQAAALADRRPVAVKTLLPAFAPTRQAVGRFLREAAILKELDHPHVVRFWDSGEVHGLLYTVMDYVEGTDAGRLVEQHGQLPVGEACRLAGQLLDALGYAHGRKFVHRDVKPGNVLLASGPDGWTLKLADFGLARAYQASQVSGLTVTNASGGTLAYMPPEQMSDFRNVGPAADQFSAAAVLYYLLTGRHRYEARSQVDWMMCLLEREPVPVRERRPEVPEALAAAVHRAMVRAPARRFASVAEFAAAVRPFVE